MTPRDITLDDIAYWADATGAARPVTMTGPGEVEAGIEPCPAILTANPDGAGGDGTVVRVAWMLDEIELAHLAKGGTLWLSTWGGLPIHSLHVQAPA